MRNFSEFEKGIIKQLVEVDLRKSNILDLVANTVLQDRGIEIDDRDKIIFLWHKRDDKSVLTEFFETISLLKYLEVNFLIFKHTNKSEKHFKGNFVRKNLTEEDLHKNSPLFIKEPIPTNLYDIINDYKRSFFVVGTELRELVKNHFKTTEQIHFEKELKISKLSFIIALVALCFSFTSPFIFETKISKRQIDEVILELKSLVLHKDANYKNQITAEQIDSLLPDEK